MMEEVRGKKEDGRWKREDGRGKMEEGRWKREDGRSYKLNSDNILVKYSRFWEFCLIFASNNAKTGCTSA